MDENNSLDVGITPILDDNSEAIRAAGDIGENTSLEVGVSSIVDGTPEPVQGSRLDKWLAYFAGKTSEKPEGVNSHLERWFNELDGIPILNKTIEASDVVEGRTYWCRFKYAGYDGIGICSRRSAERVGFRTFDVYVSDANVESYTIYDY